MVGVGRDPRGSEKGEKHKCEGAYERAQEDETFCAGRQSMNRLVKEETATC